MESAKDVVLNKSSTLKDALEISPSKKTVTFHNEYASIEAHTLRTEVSKDIISDSTSRQHASKNAEKS